MSRLFEAWYWSAIDDPDQEEWVSQYFSIYRRKSEKEIEEERRKEEEERRKRQEAIKKRLAYEDEMRKRYNISQDENVNDVVSLVNKLKEYNVDYDISKSYEENKKWYFVIVLTNKLKKYNVDYDTSKSYEKNKEVYYKTIKNTLINLIKKDENQEKINNVLVDIVRNIYNIKFSKDYLNILAMYYEKKKNMYKIREIFEKLGYRYLENVIFEGPYFLVINEKGFNETLDKANEFVGRFVKNNHHRYY